MVMLSFIEGTRAQEGNIGIIGVPFIMQALAGQGYKTIIAMGGQPILSSLRQLYPDIAAVMEAPRRNVAGAVVFPARGQWRFSPAMVFAARRHLRAVDFISLHSLYSFPVLVGYLLARVWRKPYALWLHGVLAPVQRQVSPRKKAVYDRLFARRILKDAAVIVFTSRGEREETRPLGLTAPGVVIPNGIQAGDFARLPPRGRFRARYLSGHEGPLVLYLGRLDPKKGLDLLAQAMARVVAAVPQARLALVGPAGSPCFARQVALWFRQAGLGEAAVLTGAITDLEEKRQVLADADVFVLPSVAENFGLAIFEAMAARVPVVVSETLDYAGEVEAWEAGLAVRREAGELAGAIIRLLGDPLLRQRLGENGLRLAQSYSWERTAANVDRAIRCVLAGQPLPADLTR